jgi:signal recognition particle subunit SEC65
VGKEASIPQPTLDAVAWAANKAGIKKTKKQPEASHPSRPFAREGRLILSASDAMEATGESSKEGIMREIGVIMREQMKKSKEEGAKEMVSPPKGNRQKRAQRKSFRQKSGGQRKKKFGRK